MRRVNKAKRETRGRVASAYCTPGAIMVSGAGYGDIRGETRKSRENVCTKNVKKNDLVKECEDHSLYTQCT